MQETLNIFRANLDRVRSMHAVYLHLSGQVTPAVDLSDLLRAEMVLIVSALDQSVHEPTRLGMMEVWRGERNRTPAFDRFLVSLNVVRQLAGTGRVDAHLEKEIRTRHSFVSFQQPDNITDAVRLFCAVELWNEIGVLLGEDPKDLKARLKLLVGRRNKIAHEADIDPSYPDQRWPIGQKDAEDAVAFVEKVGEAIYKLLI